jgi:uncharacterized protein (TIGR04255 family)
MSMENTPLKHPPIVEAVVDIDCDLPAGLDFASLEESARGLFRDKYPGFRRLFHQPPQRISGGVSPELDIRAATYGFQLISEEQPQLIQLRRGGFSFNRFAPYSSLDDYLAEIERTWLLFAGLVSPVAIQRIALRYINRILLPAPDGTADLDDYLRLGPKLPKEISVELTATLNHYAAVERSTGHEVNVTITVEEQAHPPLNVILDIAASHPGSSEPETWENIKGTILSLRRLNNAIFWNSLTERCLNLFR